MRKRTMVVALILICILFSGCSAEEQEEPLPDRYSKIPADRVKITPEADRYPPQLHSEEYEKPVPLEVINTAGAEDSPFIPADRDELYFFFTPDVRVPVEKQILDGVTGIYVSNINNATFQEPKRVMLQDTGKLALDGCEFIRANEMLFCSAREGYTGLHWFLAKYKDGKWTDWENADFDPEYEVGELHVHGNELYYHSARPGGKGDSDIWMLTSINGEWTDPVNIEVVNSAQNEGMPYITPDGNQLWFNRWYMGSPAIFRSEKIEGEWQEPELIISQFAGEPTLDRDGNIYFVHHFYEDGEMLEADIYVAYRK